MMNCWFSITNSITSWTVSCVIAATSEQVIVYWASYMISPLVIRHVVISHSDTPKRTYHSLTCVGPWLATAYLRTPRNQQSPLSMQVSLNMWNFQISNACKFKYKHVHFRKPQTQSVEITLLVQMTHSDHILTRRSRSAVPTTSPTKRRRIIWKRERRDNVISHTGVK